jgi:flagellar L-ring protein precursor FlgH
MIAMRLPFLLLLLAVQTATAESLYREQEFRAPVADIKAYRPGDSLTVLIVENSSAQSTTDTRSSREQAASLEASSLRNPPPVGATVRTNNEFDTQGTTQRSGKLLAQITVTVLGVAPNGELHVAGQQVIEINNEKQQIRLQGRVRPYDISGNSVLSTRLADAAISYVGDGDLSDRQRPSWWLRLLTWLGL